METSNHSIYIRLKQLTGALNRTYPDGRNPYQIMTRLLEECGELAEQVHIFEGDGVKRQKHGEPDKSKMAKEVMDVLRCALQVVEYYDLEQELFESVEKSYQGWQAKGMIRE